MALLLSAVVGSALLLVDFTLHWPTSDARARLYLLLWIAPLQVGGPYLLAALVAGQAATYAAGWRSRAAVLGSAAGSLVVVLALYLRLFSWLVWLHEPDVPAWGSASRLAGAGIASALAFGTARWLQRRLTRFSASRAPC